MSHIAIIMTSLISPSISGELMSFFYYSLRLSSPDIDEYIRDANS